MNKSNKQSIKGNICTVDLSDEIDYISSGKRQISSYLKYHIQDGSQQSHVHVARFPLLLLIGAYNNA